MDLARLDHLSRSLATAGPRRRLLGLLAAVPLVGDLLSLPDAEDTLAKDRRRRRKQRHKQRKQHHGKSRKECKPKGKGKICAEACGPVRSRHTCGKTVNCGPCACDPACPECFTCQGAAGTPGTCVPTAAGASCGHSATCDSGALQPQGACNGNGVCEAASPISCAPYTQCDGDVCATTCAGDSDCVTGSFCEGGQCVGDRSNGEPCVHAGQCASGFCVNDVCCDTACDGDCQACNVAGSVGVCATAANGTTCSGSHVCCAGVCQECCDDHDCPVSTPVCVSSVCLACSGAHPCSAGCCASDGSCLAGTTDAACGVTGGACDVCAVNETCTDHACVCVPDCDGKCRGADDGCGGTCEGCGPHQICDGQRCEACDVCRSGDCTFRSVQEAINDPAQLTTIRICPGNYDEYSGKGAAVLIQFVTRPLRLIGAGDGDNPAISTIITPSNPGDLVVFIYHSSSVTLEQLRLTGASGDVGRGMIVQVCDVTLKDCTITDNHCGTGGGGILVFDTGSDVTLINTRVTGNSAPRGGGIAADRFTTVTLDAKSRVTGNTSTDETVGYGGISSDGSSTIYLPSPDNVTDNTSGGSLANCGGGATFNGDGAICTSN